MKKYRVSRVLRDFQEVSEVMWDNFKRGVEVEFSGKVGDVDIIRHDISENEVKKVWGIGGNS